MATRTRESVIEEAYDCAAVMADELSCYMTDNSLAMAGDLGTFWDRAIDLEEALEELREAILTARDG